MNIFTLPKVWDPIKFATRYGLDRDKDFYVDADKNLVVFPDLPDSPPIFEPPDPIVPQPTLQEQIDLLKLKVNNLESKTPVKP